MANSSNLPVDVDGAPRKNGTDRPGSKASIVSPSGDAAGPEGGSKHAARRGAAYGGSDASVMQAMVGGPFMGRSGNAAKKSARVNGLPE